MWTVVDWLQLLERELTLFTLFWFVVGLVDEFAIDCIWMILRLQPRFRTPHLPPSPAPETLSRPLAVFVPAWHEVDVIGATVAHMLDV